MSEGSASGGGPPRNDAPSFFSRYYLCKMLTGIILISILGKCRESFTRSSGNLPSLALPVHERACERIDARKGEGARRFDACDRRRDVRNALMLIAVRNEVHAVVGYEHGRAAKRGPIVSLSMGLRPFRNGCGVVHCKVHPDSQGPALWDMHGERSAASKAVCGTKTEESHRERP